MIEFENASFGYHPGQLVLDGITLAVQPGEHVCVLGDNGSGKSTLAKMINALIVPQDGLARIDGLNTSDPGNTLAIRSKVGMVFQNPDNQIVASLVEDEIAFGPENIGIKPKEIRSRVERALREVGLSGFEQKDVSTLSGGQKQRVAIASALAMEPKVLVLDEAGSMLDPQGRDALVDICSRLREQGMTIVSITHSIEEVMRSQRCIALEDGRVAFDGTPGELVRNDALLESLGMNPPFPLQLCRALRRSGIDIEDSLEMDSVVSTIMSKAESWLC